MTRPTPAADAYLQEYAQAGLYVMQGRLSPPEAGRFQSFPRASWDRELVLASLVPVRGIEWIYDVHGEGVNPLETPSGRTRLRALLSARGVSVVSVCADYFMERPLVDGQAAPSAASVARLRWLLGVCREMAISRIVLPFVDASRLGDERMKRATLSALHTVLPDVEDAGVEVHLETDLPPGDFASFLRDIDHPLMRVNYDSGNSAALGYHPAEEFAAYGDRIGSMHIKDRQRGGGTVPLGHGDTEFPLLRAAIIEHGYRGDFVLQIARGAPGDEVSWLTTAQQRVRAWLRGELDLCSDH